MSFQRPLILSIVTSIFTDRADLIAENIALRHQLSRLTYRLSAQASARGPRLLGVALSLLEWLEGKSGNGEASHRSGLASKGGGSVASE